MKIHSLCMLLLVLAPTVGNAEISFDSLKEQLALRFNEGKAVFVLTGKGWKIAAKRTGSRYWPDEELN